VERLVGTVVAVAARPALWPVALRQTRRLARRDWWRHPPFLPVPDPAYLSFRLETQYGDAGTPVPLDVVTYLEWCRDQERLTRGHRGGWPGTPGTSVD
jgi:hypothetical protein